MKPLVASWLFLAVSLSPAPMVAQPPANLTNLPAEISHANEFAGVTLQPARPSIPSPRLFSYASTTAGVSPLGLQLTFAPSINRYLNLRSELDYLSFGQNFPSEGWNVAARTTMASVGASLAFYPFPYHGLHFSPGVLIHNPSVADGHVWLGWPGNPSFKLNGNTYYSSENDPALAYGAVKLRRTAFTLMTGWDSRNLRKAGRFSFPIEVGVAFLGSPQLNTLVMEGQVCDAQQSNCQDGNKDASLISDLQAQANKYARNLDLLRAFPILSVGVAYHYRLRGDRNR